MKEDARDEFEKLDTDNNGYITNGNLKTELLLLYLNLFIKDEMMEVVSIFCTDQV